MIDGTYSILYIDAGNGYYPVGNLVSNSFSEDVDTIDSTTRDNAGWKTQTLTNQSYNIDFSGIVSNVTSASKINYNTIRDLKRNRQIIDWKIEDNQLNIERGKAQITSLSNEANIDEFVTFSASLQGYGSLVTNYFKFQVTTSNTGTSNNDQFSLPLTSGFTDNIKVYWGDDTSSNITSYNQSEVTHTYPTAGSYIIKIEGAITAGWIFNNGGDCLKMGDIANFGGFSCIAANIFAGCANMTSIGSDVDFLNQATNLGAYFSNCGLTSLPSTLTLANLTIGYNMFEGNSLTSLPSGMALANLTYGINMFKNNSLTSLSAVMTLASLTDGSYMFEGNSLTSLPSVMTLASLTNGTYMFRYNSLTSLPSVMTLASLTDGRVMFDGNSLTSLPSVMTLPNLVTSYYMFNNNSLTSLPSGMILANVTSAAWMFKDNSLTALPSVMTFASLTSGSSVFSNNSLTDLPSGITFSNITDGTNLLLGNTINTTRYSQLLIDIENLNSNNSFSFHGGNSQYNASGQTARNILTTSPRYVTITDGGLA